MAEVAKLEYPADVAVFTDQVEPARPDKDFEAYHNHPRPELIQSFFRSPRVVLEVGCGGGATGRLIKEKWPESMVVGMDVDAESLSLAQTVLDVVIRAEKDPCDTDMVEQSKGLIGLGTVDTLILADVLEHLENPWKVLRWLRGFLRADAQIIVSLPNVRNLGVLAGLRAGHWRYAVSGILDVTHLRFFTRESAILLLSACGYEVVNQNAVWDVRLVQQGRPGCTSLINLDGCALHGVSPADFDEMAALQHLLTARIHAGYRMPDDWAEYPASSEDKRTLPMQVQPTPTPEEIWRANQALLPQEVEWLREASGEEGFPEFVVLVRQTLRNSARARRALDSIAGQISQPKEVFILREAGVESPVLWPEVPDGMSDVPVTVVQRDDWEEVNVMLRSTGKKPASRKPRWLVFLDSGDHMASDALVRLGIAIRENPSWRVVYSDEDRVDDLGRHSQPHFKPDFLLDTLRSLPYVGGLMAIREDFLQRIGGMPTGLPGAEEYDLILRAAEVLPDAPEKIIGHVARVLYHRSPMSGTDKVNVETIVQSGQLALAAHLERCGEAAEVEFGPAPATYRPVYALPDDLPLVSVIIPTKNQFGYLQQCVDTLLEKTDYPNFEIILIDNDSTEPDARSYLDAIIANPQAFGDRIRVFPWSGSFDYSAMHNAAVREMARGEVLLFLNNDTAILHPEWLRNMMRHALRPQVGAVGAKLLFADGKIQHAGVLLGLSGGGADHPFLGLPSEDRGYYGRLVLTQNYEAVTAACMAVRRAVFDAVDGFSTEFPVQFNDVDLCLKIGSGGLRIVWTPDAILLHHGSASQRAEAQGNPDAAEQSRRILAEGNDRLFRKWPHRMARDRAYNANFTRHGRGFQYENVPALSWQEGWRPRKRVFAHAINREGTGEYRILSPARALFRAGRVQTMETMQLLTPPEMLQSAPDSVIFQLQMEDHQARGIQQWMDYCPDTLRVFEVDDLVIHLPMKNAHRPHIHPDIIKRLRNTAKRMDRMVVTTDYLAEQYQGWNQDIRVVPNFIERARWGGLSTQIVPGARPRVGWVGGISHQGDLEIIQDVVKATYRDIDWVFMGMCPESMRPYVTFVPPVPFDQYPQKVASLGLELALAPLEMHPFNMAKSHLRILEMGILGIPVLATDILPYQGFPISRVKNRYTDWIGAVRDLVADREALRSAGETLRAHIGQHWILEDRLDLWESAWT
ncbi:MAG: glycosyltransferase [Acidithiobacillus sp.]|nr:glycosyltransferase [Acidithiobacillus sp.]